MMQNLNRKNTLEDYGAEPSPLVWEKIEKQLPTSSGKKRGWLIWSAAAILVTGIFLSVYVLDIEISFKKKGTTEKPVASSEKETDRKEKSSSQKNQLQVTEHSDKNKSVTEKEKGSSKNIVLLPPKNRTSIKQRTITHAEHEITNVQEGTTTKENKTTLSEENAIVLNESSGDEKESIKNIPPVDITMIPLSGDSTLSLKEISIDFQPLKKNSASRWQWSVGAGENYNYRVLNFSSSGNTSLTEGEKNYLSEDEKGIRTFAFETGVGYHLSTHFSLNIGINYFTAGQERERSEIIFSNGTVGSPNTVYSVNTSTGTLSASGQQVDYAYFGNNDSSLFTPAYSVAVNNPSPSDSSTVQYFTLRQEFSFISLPLLIQYQMAEHRFTPYIGLGLSAGYVVQERVTLNDKKLDDYHQSTNDIIFFAEAQAGVKYRINKKIFLKLQPSFRYGLNSLNDDDSIDWIPYSAGIGAGINFRF